MKTYLVQVGGCKVLRQMGFGLIALAGIASWSVPYHYRHMVKVYESHDRIFVESLKAMLTSESIEHLVKDESSSSLGEVPPIVSCQHVWLIHENDFERAQVLVKQLENQAELSNNEPWTCSGCNEKLEAQFTACWSCGEERNV